MNELTHFDDAGRARMVDVSDKPPTVRFACARGRVRMAQSTLERCLHGRAAKGEVARVAEIAGTMAAKRTSDLIPLCHSLALSGVQVSVVADPALPGLAVVAEARTTGPTGVEMEALTAVAVACLTIYDMLKASDRAMIIEGIALEEKSGGKTGLWKRS